VAGVLAGLLIVVIGGIAGLLTLRGNGDGAQHATLAARTRAPADPSPTAASPVPSPSPSPSKAKAAPRHTGPGRVSTLPAGLFCRDLMARGYSYVAAVDYWARHGEPNQMDADRNGIPCETVYPPSDVSAYWSVRQLPSTVTVPGSLPSGLLCRDLRARGLSYADAVTYWWTEGAPDRMDADLNGIPCETVYPVADVNAYW